MATQRTYVRGQMYPTSIAMPVKHWEALTKLAKEKGYTSRSDLIREMVRDYLSANKTV